MFFLFSKPQPARPETCCLRCWSSTPLNGYRWTRPYSTPTSTCGMIQLRWRRWVGLWQSCLLITIPKLNPLRLSLNDQHCLLCTCIGAQKIMTPLILFCFFKQIIVIYNSNINFWTTVCSVSVKTAASVHLWLCFKFLVHISFSFSSHLWFYTLYLSSEL